MVLGDDSRWNSSTALWTPFEFGDPFADGVPQDLPWLDIREVHLSPLPDAPRPPGSAFKLILAGAAPTPRQDPGDAWIAYGLVFDTDGDGQADERIGIDNMAGNRHRAWWSDLDTGEVSWKAGPPYGQVGGDGQGQGGAAVIALDSAFPGDLGLGDHATLVYEPAQPEFRFYAWVSLISGGRVAFTDYAPDVAWLEPGIQPALSFAGPIWWHDTAFTSGNTSFSIVQTISVAPDGRLNINAACHAGAGALEVGEAILTVTDVALEATDCRPQGRGTEKLLLKILSSETITYRIKNGVLELRAGTREMRFTARFQGPFR